MLRGLWIALAAMACLGTCAPEAQAPKFDRASALAEVQSRPLEFAYYPSRGRTYLSFDKAHGFQVNFISSDTRAWLWYPGNSVALPEEYRRQTIRGQRALCWRHPSNTRNPVTQQSGGGFACEPLDFARKRVVASLSGDPFDLASGSEPYRLSRCVAPEQFVFDRERFGC